MMNLSKETVGILKNYSSISSNLLITAGSVLKTKSVQNTILSSVSVKEVFPLDFGIYDLNEFLGVLTLFSNPDLEFNDKYVRITEGETSIKYFAADPSVLSYPQKDIAFPSADVSFKLSAETLALIVKTSSVLRVPDVTFSGADGELKMTVADKKNATSNAFEVKIGKTDLNFNIDLKIEMMKFIPTDYEVEISSKRISKFTAVGSDLNYFIGVESSSTFE
jgi:hypothetical protein